MMSLKLVLIGWCATALAARRLTSDELEAVLSALKVLAVGKCVLLSEGQGPSGREEVRKLSENFVLAGVMGEEELEGFLGEPKPPDAATAIVLKVDTPSALKTLLTQNSNRLHWFVWFLVSPADLPPEIRIPVNCQFFHVKGGAPGGAPARTHHLVETYHLKNSSAFRNEFARWTPAGGLTAPTLNMYRRRTDFKGVELEVTLCHKHGFEEKLMLFWMDFARILNFSLKMEPQRLNKTAEGYVLLQDPDGSNCVWGITGLDFDKDWVVFHPRIKWALFRVKLLMKFRGSNDIGWRAYIRPFKIQMWGAIGAWLLISTLAIIIVNGCTKKSLYLNIFTAFFCLCNSDPMTVHPPNQPVSLTTKLVYLMVLTAPSILVPAYSAYVLSTLSIVLPLEPFRDLKGLIADGTYRVTAADNTFAIRYLRRSADPEVRYIYRHLFVGADDVAPTFPTMFQELCNDNKLAGLFPYTTSFRNLFPCRMFIMPQDLITISTGLLFRKGSPLRKIFNERYNEYYEKGLLRTSDQTTLYDKFGEESDALGSLSLFQTGPIFLLVPLGLALSLAVLCLEIATKKRGESRSEQSKHLT